MRGWLETLDTARVAGLIALAACACLFLLRKEFGSIAVKIGD